MSGQSVVDRLNAAKHSISGQGIAKAVCKATTEEVLGPKRKHLDYLLQCTHEANVSVPQLADLLIQRTQTNNWVVVFKSLITVHNIMNYGNERFMQYMASNTVSSNLESFVDKSNPQGYDMSTYIRKYAKYINEKSVSYRQMAFDFCKVKRGKEDGLLRTMAPDKLLKSLPILQAQLDALLEFDPTLNELNNGVINAAFLLLFKDLIRLFACYNDGIINLLEKYFDLNRKQCKEGLEIYKKFVVRMDKTGEFLKVAENVGIEKGDIPDLTKAPASLLEALEAHLASLEGKKASKGQSSAASGAVSAKVITEEDKKRILQEEDKELAKLKEHKLKQGADSPPSTAAHPAQPAAPRAAAPAVSQSASASNLQPTQQRPPAASNDLLALDHNPFQEKVQSIMALAATSQPNAASPWMMQQPSVMPQNGHNRLGSGSFTNSQGFAAVFNSPKTSGSVNTSQPGVYPIAPTLEPLRLHKTASHSQSGDLFGEVLQPQGTSQMVAPQKQKLVQGDLDSSLASLAGSLSVSSTGQTKANLQWTAPTEKKLTGGSSFSGITPAAGTWSVPQQPMMIPSANVYPAAQPTYAAAPFMYNTAPQYPAYGMRPLAPAYQPNMVQPNIVQPNMTQPTFTPQPIRTQPLQQADHQKAAQQFDPFGSL